MEKITVYNEMNEHTFIGELLSESTSKYDKDFIANRWTEFKIYLTDEDTQVVTIKCNVNPDSKGRYFICPTMEDVRKCLLHPEYQTLSYAAKRAYNEAFEKAKIIFTRENMDMDIDYSDNFEED